MRVSGEVEDGVLESREEEVASLDMLRRKMDGDFVEGRYWLLGRRGNKHGG